MPAIRNPKGMSYFHTLVTLPTLAPHLAAAAEHEPNGLSGIEDEVEGLEVENHPPVSSGRTGVLTRAAAQASSSTASSASTQNSGMNHTAALPFFMQPGATAAAGNAASGAAPTNAMATPNVEAVAGGPEPGTSVITVLDDDEDDVAIQAGITVSNNMVHRMQSSALLNSNQSSASAASSSKSNNRDARGKGKGKGKRKSIATTDERAMMTLANLHEKGQVLLTGNGTKLQVRESNNALAIGRMIRSYYLKTANLAAKEAIDFEAQQDLRKQVHNKQEALAELVIERKKIAAAMAVKQAKKSQKLVKISHDKAGEAFLNDLEENEDSDNEVDYNDVIETSSVADRFEELEPFNVADDDDDDVVEIDAMIVDALGNGVPDGGEN